MEITYEIKLLDFIVAGWYQTLRNPSARKIFLFPILFPMLLPAYWLIHVAFGGSYPQGLFWPTLFEILTSSLWFTAFLGTMMFVVQTIAIVIMKPKEKRNGVTCLHTIILDEKDLIEITDVNTTFSDWSGFRSIDSLPNCVLIQNNANQFHAIPKRYFEDKKHVAEFVELANYYREQAVKFPERSGAEALIYNRQEEVKKLLDYRKSLDNSSRVQRLVDETEN